jgi:hypothetical protein
VHDSFRCQRSHLVTTRPVITSQLVYQAVIAGRKLRWSCQASAPKPRQTIAKRTTPPRYGMNPTMVRIKRPTSSPSSQSRLMVPDVAQAYLAGRKGSPCFFATMRRRPQLNETIPSNPGRSYIIHIKDFTPSVPFDSGTKLASQTMVRKLFITVENSEKLSQIQLEGLSRNVMGILLRGSHPVGLTPLGKRGLIL